MYASMNCLSKSAFRKAVLEQGLPVVLWHPELAIPAINGPHRVEGPWPGTRPPVEEIRTRGERRTHPRQKLLTWHADVVVRDMRIVEVH